MSSSYLANRNKATLPAKLAPPEIGGIPRAKRLQDERGSQNAFARVVPEAQYAHMFPLSGVFSFQDAHGLRTTASRTHSAPLTGAFLASAFRTFPAAILSTLARRRQARRPRSLR